MQLKSASPTLVMRIPGDADDSDVMAQCIVKCFCVLMCLCFFVAGIAAARKVIVDKRQLRVVLQRLDVVYSCGFSGAIF